MNTFFLVLKSFFASVLLASVAQGVGPTGVLDCVFSPRLYVGNAHLTVDLHARTFEISSDDPRVANRRIVSVRGTAGSQGRDSMGFEQIYLCTAQPCSGETMLGFFKAVDQAQGRFGDRVSYLRINPLSRVQIRVTQLGRDRLIVGLNELECQVR